MRTVGGDRRIPWPVTVVVSHGQRAQYSLVSKRGIESGQGRFEFNGLWFDIEFEILRR